PTSSLHTTLLLRQRLLRFCPPNPPPSPSAICPLPLHDALPISRSRMTPETSTSMRASDCSTSSSEARVVLPARTTTATLEDVLQDRKSTRLNSSHVKISYAVFC